MILALHLLNSSSLQYPCLIPSAFIPHLASFFQEETQRVCDELKSLRSTREETLLEIRREEERLNLAKKRREEEEEETKRVEEEGGAKAEERMMVEKEWEAALQKLVRTRWAKLSYGYLTTSVSESAHRGKMSSCIFDVNLILLTVACR